jgi:hypothetical protein
MKNNSLQKAPCTCKKNQIFSNFFFFFQNHFKNQKMCITELIPALGAPQKLLSASLSALWFGSALWFTFISTPINHRILKKADFIAVQAKLLPMHLAIGLVAPAARLYLRIDSTFAVSDGGLVWAISGALGGDPGLRVGIFFSYHFFC